MQCMKQNCELFALVKIRMCIAQTLLTVMAMFELSKHYGIWKQLYNVEVWDLNLFLKQMEYLSLACKVAITLYMRVINVLICIYHFCRYLLFIININKNSYEV